LIVNLIHSLSYSPDGQIIATGGLDGKIRLWDTKSYMCFSTMSEHSTKVTGIAFTSRANTVVSSSLDGTIKAYDTKKYRCFRTFKPDLAAQFNCVIVNFTFNNFEGFLNLF